MTEILKIEGAEMVRLQQNGKTFDIPWPATGGDLVLSSGDGGTVAHGPAVDGFHSFARFPGSGITPANIRVSARPTVPATPPTITISAFSA